MKKSSLPNKSNKLDQIFQFLKGTNRRKYNSKVQEGFLKTWVNDMNSTTNEKIYNLLFNLVNTQSQPKLDKLSTFFKKINSNKIQLNSFTNFNKFLLKNDNISFQNLFLKLEKESGWGKKTAALFVKTIYEMHNGRFKDFKIWNDVPKLEKGDKLYLPVDQVIEKIFSKIYGKDLKFDKINEILQEQFTNPNDLIIWDDLWYWGFITQKGSGKNRIFDDFNESKYWCMQFSTKNEIEIKKIKEECKIFLKLIK